MLLSCCQGLAKVAGPHYKYGPELVGFCKQFTFYNEVRIRASSFTYQYSYLCGQFKEGNLLSDGQ